MSSMGRCIVGGRTCAASDIDLAKSEYQRHNVQVDPGDDHEDHFSLKRCHHWENNVEKKGTLKRLAFEAV